MKNLKLILEYIKMELKIKEIAKNNLTKIIHTLPITPTYFKITLQADGIGEFLQYEKEDKERYLTECYKSNVIPFSRIKFKYSLDEKAFAPQNETLVPMWGEIDTRNTAFPSIINGGKIHELNFEGSSIFTEVGFNKFKDESLDILLKAGYEFLNWDIWLFHNSGRPVTNIMYDKENKTELRLIIRNSDRISSGVTPKSTDLKVKDLKDWFNKFDKNKKQIDLDLI